MENKLRTESQIEAVKVWKTGANVYDKKSGLRSGYIVNRSWVEPQRAS